MTENTKQLLGDSHNYCRNPDNDRYGPWCYTYDHGPDSEEWGYCGIPFCGMQKCLQLVVYVKPEAIQLIKYQKYIPVNHNRAF